MGDRLLALTSRRIFIISLWPSVYDKETDGLCIRVSNELASDGSEVVVARADGVDLKFHHDLPQNFTYTEVFSYAPINVSFVLPWRFEHIDPADVNFNAGVGELAIIHETDGVIDGWEDRDVRIAGTISGWRWGTKYETIQMTLTSTALEDDGNFWGPGDEINTTRFPDVGEDDTPASRAQGLLLPYTLAPVNSQQLAPGVCVINQDDAVFGVSAIQYRIFALGAARPTDHTNTHQFALAHPLYDGRFAAPIDSVVYRESIISYDDDAGGRFWGVDGNFRETIGTSSTQWTNGSDEVTSLKSRGVIAEGDTVRRIPDASDEWAQVDSVDGTTTTLTANYNGSTGTSAGYLIRSPSQKGYQIYRVCTRGGDSLEDEDYPRTRIIDVLLWAFRHASLPVEIAIGDLEALRPLVDHLFVSCVLNKRIAPFEWAEQKILQWLPIRPYMDGPRLRFRWVGLVTEDEIVAEFDLDELGSAWRIGPIQNINESSLYSVNMSYFWDVHRQLYRRSISQDATESIPYNPTSGSPYEICGRALNAYHNWLSAGGRTNGSVDLECDSFEFVRDAGNLVNYVLYREGQLNQSMELAVPQQYSYIRLGDVVRAYETGVTSSAQLWRVEGKKVSTAEEEVLILESIPD